MVQQPARRGDQHLDAGPQRFFLRPHSGTAHEKAGAQGGVVSEPQKHVVDLLRELARGRDDQRFRQTPGQTKELVKDRQ